jgi:hypothetical protein
MIIVTFNLKQSGGLRIRFVVCTQRWRPGFLIEEYMGSKFHRAIILYAPNIFLMPNEAIFPFYQPSLSPLTREFDYQTMPVCSTFSP